MRILKTLSVIDKNKAEVKLAEADQNIKRMSDRLATIENYISRIRADISEGKSATGYDFRCVIGYMNLSVDAINKSEFEMRSHKLNQEKAITMVAKEIDRQKALDKIDIEGQQGLGRFDVC